MADLSAPLEGQLEGQLDPSSPSGETMMMVITGRGRDRPGIVEAMTRAVTAHDGRVLDMTQFLLEGSLVINVVLQVHNKCSMTLMTELLQCARPLKLDLDFHFPEGHTATAAGLPGHHPGENMVALTVASPEQITPALLHDLDVVLCEHGCTVLEIEHRSDDKIENNGEYNKIQLRVSCPAGLKLATLYMGDGPSWGSGQSLQAVAGAMNAVITVRWWDAMNRPNGKSLVVFGLTSVLCPIDVLGAVLEEAGVDEADSSPQSNSKLGLLQQNKAKVSLLRGRSADAVQRVIQRLKFTPGARLVCAALRSIGCRLAILSSTGLREIGEHFRHELGIDYVMCQDLEVVDGCFTGEYAGDSAEVRFQKLDLLKLMADREGIAYKNVIVVGEFLRGLTASNARIMLETFGLNVFFNAARLRDLTIALYLLGFSGSNVRALRQRFEPDCLKPSPSAPMLAEEHREVKRFMVEVSTRRRVPGLIQRIFAPLLPLGDKAGIATVRQCSLHEGGMCLGMDLRAYGLDPVVAARDLLFACNTNGFQTWMREPPTMPTKTPDISMHHYSHNRYCLTLVQSPWITPTCLAAVLGICAARAINIVKLERLSTHKEFKAVQLTLVLPQNVDADSFSSELLRASQEQGADVAIQRDDVDRWMRRMVIFDMDTTLVQRDMSLELAKAAGVEEETQEILQAASEERMTFSESLKARAALLKGCNAEEVFAKVNAEISLTPGAMRLCSILKKLGYKTALISGGFLPIANEVQRRLGLDYSFANVLEVDDERGTFTGATSGPLVTPERKRALLATMANIEGCEVQQTVAVGDGSKDVPLLSTAGLGISFRAKPKQQATMGFTINHTDLSLVLYLIGLSENAVERLGGSPDPEREDPAEA